AGDEDNIQIRRELAPWISHSVVGVVERLVTELAAPDRDRLGRDRGVLLPHEQTICQVGRITGWRSQDFQYPYLHRVPPQTSMLVSRAGSSRMPRRALRWAVVNGPDATK